VKDPHEADGTLEADGANLPESAAGLEGTAGDHLGDPEPELPDEKGADRLIADVPPLPPAPIH
jgi:hypothetical protein